MITGKVLDDRNGYTPDTFDAADTGISGVTLALYAPTDTGFNTPLQTTTTDGDGVYTFYATAGSYVIKQTDLAGYISIRDQESTDPVTGAISGNTTAPSYTQVASPGDVYNQISRTVAAGEEYYENNFLDLTPWTISGYVYDDSTGGSNDAFDAGDTGVLGVLITLYKDTNGDGTFETTVTTDNTLADGSYSFQVGSGKYRVIETNSAGYTNITDSEGHTADPAWNQIDITLNSGDLNSAGNNFLDEAAATPPPVINLDPDNSLGDLDDKNNEVTYTEDTAAVNVADSADAAVTDSDDTHMVTLTLTAANISDGVNEVFYVGGGFPQNADSTSDVTIGNTDFHIVYTTGVTGTFAITGQDTVTSVNEMRIDDINTLIRGITYINFSNNPTTATNRTLTFVTNDGDGDSNTVVSTITVVATNDPPDINLDPTNSSGGADDKNFPVASTEGDAAKSVTAADAAVTDPDDTSMVSFKITAAGISDGASEIFTATGTAFPQDADKSASNLNVGGTDNFDIAYTQASGEFVITRNGGGEMLK
ncbi:MAG: hypothetical protein GY749_01000, partial [Desulfobacteraceae bacterium]|nr:hypothetical protein [Desulfobacteraceae bacterium]